MTLRNIIHTLQELFKDHPMAQPEQQQNEIFWLTRRLRKEKDFKTKKEIEEKIIEKELKIKKKVSQWKN